MKVTKLATSSLLALALTLALPAFGAEQTKAAANGAALSFEQIKMAAQSGDADAQYALGYMYYYGKSGATKDVNEAKKWISKSAAQKQPQAMKALDLMNKQAGSSVASNNTTQTTTIANSSVPTQNNANTNVATTQPKVATEQKPVPATNVTGQQKTTNAVAPVTHNETKETELREKLAQENKETLVDMRNQSSQPNDATTAPKKEENSQSIDEEIRKEKSISVTSKNEHGNFTLQLLGSYHKDLVAKEKAAKHLGSQAQIYQTKFNNKDWYVLLYGRYENANQAKEAARSLEGKMAMKPWVKPVATIKTYKKLAD